MEYLYSMIIVDGKPENGINTILQNKIVVYEVLRILNKTPLFVEKHLRRIDNSAKLLGKKLPFSGSEFKNLIDMLITENNISVGNIKISVLYNDDEKPLQSIIGFIPHKYPSQEDYKTGVKTVLSINQRINPGAKVQNDNLRNELNKFMDAENAYEAILVHPEGYITEGSRSNIFFIAGNKIFTAPDDHVLSGITRENVIELCRTHNFNLELISINYKDLNKMDAAFITGTSPKVLPIRSINDIEFKLPHPIISELLKKYDELITDYIRLYH